MRILLVEDIVDLADAVRAHLSSLGYAVEWLADGEGVVDALKEASFDLVILDIMLPRRDGFHVLADIRRSRSRVPVLITTALAASMTRSISSISAPTTTSSSPYDLREFTARVRALLRRVEGERAAVLRFGNFRYDRARRVAEIGGEAIELTRREQQLLELLVGRFGSTIDRERLIDRIFTEDDGRRSQCARGPRLAREAQDRRLRCRVGDGARHRLRVAGGVRPCPRSDPANPSGHASPRRPSCCWGC